MDEEKKAAMLKIEWNEKKTPPHRTDVKCTPGCGNIYMCVYFWGTCNPWNMQIKWAYFRAMQLSIFFATALTLLCCEMKNDCSKIPLEKAWWEGKGDDEKEWCNTVYTELFIYLQLCALIIIHFTTVNWQADPFQLKRHPFHSLFFNQHRKKLLKLSNIFCPFWTFSITLTV